METTTIKRILARGAKKLSLILGIAALGAATSANADFVMKAGTTTANWSDEGLWVGDSGNYVIPHDSPNADITFTAAESIATGFWIENASGLVKFQASDSTCGLTMTVGDMHVGGLNYGYLEIESGTYDFQNDLYIAYSKAHWYDGDKGSFTVKGGSVTVGNRIVVANYGGTVGTEGELYISGGTLATKTIVAGAGTGKVEFYGGTLKATADGTLIGSGLTVNVPDGYSGTIDTDGHAVTVASAIGGTGTLNVTGGGTVTFGDMSGFTGNLVVSQDTVVTFSGAVSLTSITGAGDIVFSSAGTLELTDRSGSSLNSLTASGTLTVIANGAIGVSEITANANITFAAKMATSSLVKKGAGTLTFCGVTVPTAGITVEAGDVIVNNSLEGVSPVVILDASVADTITETDGKVTSWASTVNGHSFANAESAMTYVAAEGVFGGKKTVRTNYSQLQSDFSNAGASLSVFAAMHYYGNNGTGGLLFHRTGANNVYIGKRNSSDKFWSALRTSKTPIPLWQNSGALNDNFVTQDTVLSVENLSNGSAALNHVGGTSGDVAIAELITLSSDPSIADRKRIEAHLGTKWGVQDMTTLPQSIPLTVAGGTSIDIKDLSRTFDSIAVTGTGVASVKGGVLVITAPISVGDDQRLVIPYGSTYTLADAATQAFEDEEAGTITITKGEVAFAADIDGVHYSTVQEAIDAYESGTLTIYESATVTLTKAISISGIVLENGAELTVSQMPPFSVTFDAATGTLESVRNAATFVYVVGGYYDVTPGNFTIDGAAASDVPGAADTVQFDTDTTISLSGSDYRYSAVVVNANVTLNGANNYNYFNTDSISGTGKLSLGNNAKIATISRAATFTCEIEVNAADATPSYLHVADSGREITLEGVLSGAGYVKCTRKNNAANYSGCTFKCSSTANFSGTIEMVKPSSGDVGRNLITFWPTCDLSKATVIVGNYSSGHGRIIDGQTGSSVYKFGSFSGYVSPSAANVGNNHPTIEIGALGKNDTVTGNWMPHESRNPYIRKVGSGTLTTSANSAYGYILEGGTLSISADAAVPAQNVQFNGGTLKQTADSTADISGKIGASTSAVAFDDGDVDRTWATALASSNVGFTKAGTGTLTLAAEPQYQGLTSVMAGTLVVPNDSEFFTYEANKVNALGEGTIEYANGETVSVKYAYPAGTTLDGTETGDDALDGDLDFSGVTKIDVSAQTLTVGQAFVIAGTSGNITGLDKSKIELVVPECPEGVNEKRWAWTIRRMFVDGKKCVCVAPATIPLCIIIQ